MGKVGQVVLEARAKVTVVLGALVLVEGGACVVLHSLCSLRHMDTQRTLRLAHHRRILHRWSKNIPESPGTYAAERAAQVEAVAEVMVPVVMAAETVWRAAGHSQSSQSHKSTTCTGRQAHHRHRHRQTAMGNLGCRRTSVVLVCMLHT